MVQKHQLLVLSVLVLGCGQSPAIVTGAGSDASDLEAPSTKPHVTLLIDTSGSMLNMNSCRCDANGCELCLPNCDRGERARWHDVLAAVGGSFEDFGCTWRDRTEENGTTYDLHYPKPFFPLTASARQRSDGLLDRHGDSVQFGLATFDGMRTYPGASDLVPLGDFDFALSIGPQGGFSYGSDATAPRMRPDGSVVGRVAYPGSDEFHFVDNGIMGPFATEGALIVPHADADPVDTVARIKEQLRAVRPFGSTPIASALDDLYLALSEPRAAPDRSAQQYVLLITDGSPDDDFRDYPDPGCACAAQGDCPPNVDPARLSCPYPTAEEAARALHCGFTPGTCEGPVAQLHIVGLATRAEQKTVLASLAAAGGGSTHFPTTSDELNQALDAVLADISKDAAR